MISKELLSELVEEEVVEVNSVSPFGITYTNNKTEIVDINLDLLSYKCIKNLSEDGYTVHKLSDQSNMNFVIGVHDSENNRLCYTQEHKTSKEIAIIEAFSFMKEHIKKIK